MYARDKSYEALTIAAMRDLVEAAYPEVVTELDDPGALLVVLRQIAKEYGMTKSRAKPGCLFRTLSDKGNRTLTTYGAQATSCGGAAPKCEASVRMHRI